MEDGVSRRNVLRGAVAGGLSFLVGCDDPEDENVVRMRMYVDRSDGGIDSGIKVEKEIVKPEAVFENVEEGDFTRWILERDVYTPRSITGSLYLDGNGNGKVDGDECLAYTLELPWKKNMQYVSCIPAGEYDVVEDSGTIIIPGRHYKLKDVLGREGVSVHVGNWPKDTAGCILVGNLRLKDEVKNSRVTLNKLLKRFAGEKVKLLIKDKR